MHSLVQKVGLHHSDTTRCETSQHLCSQKYAMKCVLNLKPMTSDQLNGASANSQDGARLNVSAHGVWGGRFQRVFFVVRVLSPSPLLTETRH